MFFSWLSCCKQPCFLYQFVNCVIYLNHLISELLKLRTVTSRIEIQSNRDTPKNSHPYCSVGFDIDFYFIQYSKFMIMIHQ